MRHLTLCAVVLAAAVFTGCDRDDSATTTTPDATTTTPDTTTGAMKQDASNAAASMEKSANDAANAAGSTAQTQPTGSEAAGSVTAQAQKYFDEAMTYIKEKKWDLAETSIKKLEELKPKLPTQWQSKVDTLRSTYNAAKSGLSDVKLPGLN